MPEMWTLFILAVLCMPIIYARRGEKKAERFEDRDN
jgi:hypothetical protein